MTITDNLSLPYIAAAQAQKHVTHNEALRRLDAVVMLAVADRDLATPPEEPAPGIRYIIAAGPDGDWSDHADDVAAWQDGAWTFLTPRPGWLAYVIDEALLVVWEGENWTPVAGSDELQNIVLLGLGTEADATNPFAAKLNNALWSAREIAEGGDGDLRCKLNKETAANTLSLLFQTGFEGRAEIGLAGDDDLSVKVSADGEAWRTALTVKHDSGSVDFLAPAAGIASAATCDIGGAASLRVVVTGSTTITSFGTEPNRLRVIEFAGAVTLTHHATALVLPTGADIVTAAGDVAVALSDAAGDWRVALYQRASGDALGHAALLAAENTWTAPQNVVVASVIPAIWRNPSGQSEPRIQAYSDVAGDMAGITFNRYRGSVASPAAQQAGDRLSQFTFSGRATAGSINSAALAVYAAEDFVSGAAAGTYYSFEAVPVGSAGRVQALRIGDGGKVFVPNIGTTAIDPNLAVDTGSSPGNQVLRSTSSLRFKRDVEPLEAAAADRVMALSPIWYRSSAPADAPGWSWYGLAAEEVAAIDPRLVHYGFPDEAYDHEAVVEEVERTAMVDGREVRWTEETRRVVSTLREGAVKVPMSVMYSRLPVMLIDVVKRQQQAIAVLQTQVSGVLQRERDRTPPDSRID